jgi:transcriptional regulator with XRE-family HTH domain
MNQIYFEAKGEALLKRIGMSKSEFARQMGIRKQNVKALFKTKNLETIYKAATVMGVPFEMLVGYIDEPDPGEIPIEPFEGDDIITAEDIPTGDSTDDRRARHKLILRFYHQWKHKNPEAKRYNFSLKDDINIKNVSLVETAGHASLTYLSTLAVLQLDAILANAIFVEEVPANHKKTNQNMFERMLRMEYRCIGIGLIKLLVGVKRSDKTKVQYCITVIEAEKGRPRRTSQ